MLNHLVFISTGFPHSLQFQFMQILISATSFFQMLSQLVEGKFWLVCKMQSGWTPPPLLFFGSQKVSNGKKWKLQKNAKKEKKKKIQTFLKIRICYTIFDKHRFTDISRSMEVQCITENQISNYHKIRFQRGEEGGGELCSWQTFA